ncbi:hypothetical protein ACJJTC_006520 [Scirpophaga incertulas]
MRYLTSDVQNATVKWCVAWQVTYGFEGCIADLRLDGEPLPLEEGGASASGRAQLTRRVRARLAAECAPLPAPGRVAPSTRACTGGTCRAAAGAAGAAGGFACACHARFLGARCEHDADPCASQPCLHGGRCAAADGAFRCACAAGLAGSALRARPLVRRGRRARLLPLPLPAGQNRHELRQPPSYGSAGDELEGIPPDYRRNLNIDPADRKPWSEQMHLHTFVDNKIYNASSYLLHPDTYLPPAPGAGPPPGPGPGPAPEAGEDESSLRGRGLRAADAARPHHDCSVSLLLFNIRTQFAMGSGAGSCSDLSANLCEIEESEAEEEEEEGVARGARHTDV